MTLTKKTLLALFGVTALVGVAASASAEDWDFSAFWSPQKTYVSQDDRDRGDNYGYYGQGRYDRGENRDWSNQSYNRNYNRDSGERSYSWNRSYGDGNSYRNGYSGYNNGYVRQDRGEHQYYGEHRDRDESDDD